LGQSIRCQCGGNIGIYTCHRIYFPMLIFAF
jgi:hypothetical protein